MGDTVAGEQLVVISGPMEYLPGALALLTPFIEKSGDSVAFAKQDYSAFGGGGDGGFGYKGDGGFKGDDGGKSKGYGKDAFGKAFAAFGAKGGTAIGAPRASPMAGKGMFAGKGFGAGGKKGGGFGEFHAAPAPELGDIEEQ